MANAFNINNDAVVVLTNKLEKLHRSALPVAIRETLNNAAFDVKQDTMLKSSKRHFINRNRNFFKANSRVDKAKGFDVDNMKATVGFITSKLKGSDQAVEDLEEQEYGGKIEGRTFIPNREGIKASSMPKKAIPKRNRVRTLLSQKMVNLRKIKGANWAQKAIKASVKAGKGGLVLSRSSSRLGVVWRVKSIKRSGGNTRFERQDILYINKSGSVKVKKTGFMSSATLKSAKKLNNFYIKQAEKQIKRLTG